MTAKDNVTPLEKARVLFEEIVGELPSPPEGEIKRLVELVNAQFFEYTEDHQEDLEQVCLRLKAMASLQVQALMLLGDAPRVATRKLSNYYRSDTGVNQTTGEEYKRTPGYYELTEEDRCAGIFKRMTEAKRLTGKLKPRAVETLVYSHAGYDKRTAVTA